MTIPIMMQLRDATASYHSRLEALPFFTALIDHRLTLDSYVGQLADRSRPLFQRLDKRGERHA